MSNSAIIQSALILLVLLAIARGQEAATRRPGGANESFAVSEFRGTNGHTLRYSLFVPPSKGSEKPTPKLPLVLCLHGAGGNTAAANVLAGAEMQQKYPCVVMAPT